MNLSDNTPDNSAITDFQSVAKSLLPSPSDNVALKRNISPLVSRVRVLMLSSSSCTSATDFMKK